MSIICKVAYERAKLKFELFLRFIQEITAPEREYSVTAENINDDEVRDVLHVSNNLSEATNALEVLESSIQPKFVFP